MARCRRQTVASNGALRANANALIGSRDASTANRKVNEEVRASLIF